MPEKFPLPGAPKGEKKKGAKKTEDMSEAQQAQADEAIVRRTHLAEIYHPSVEEINEGRRKLQAMVEKLTSVSSSAEEELTRRSSTLEEIVNALDSLYNTNHAREGELQQLLIRSMAAKISESIRHFLPLETQNEVKPLLSELESNFSSFQDLFEKLKEYEPAFNTHGISRSVVAELFILELEKYLDRYLDPVPPEPKTFLFPEEPEIEKKSLKEMSLDELEERIRQLTQDLRETTKGNTATPQLQKILADILNERGLYQQEVQRRKRQMKSGKKGRKEE